MWPIQLLLLQKSTVQYVTYSYDNACISKGSSQAFLLHNATLKRPLDQRQLFSIELQAFLWHSFLVIVSPNTSMFPPYYWLTCSPLFLSQISEWPVWADQRGARFRSTGQVIMTSLPSPPLPSQLLLLISSCSGEGDCSWMISFFLNCRG